MSIFSNKFINIIEWIPAGNNTIVYRYPCYKNDIKYGAKLTVQPGQVTAFVNNNNLADVFQPGDYQLDITNLPILSTQQNWQSDSKKSFKSEVYFFNTTDFLNLKWLTKQNISLQDENFGLVRLQAIGSFTTRINNAEIFLKRLIGKDGQFEIDELSEQLSDAIVSALPTVLTNAKISVFELAANYNHISNAIKAMVERDFSQYGLLLNQIYIDNISLPDNIQKEIDEKTNQNSNNTNATNQVKTKAEKPTKAIAAENVEIKENSEQASQSNEQLDSLEKINQKLLPNQGEAQLNEIPKVYYLMILGERKGPMNALQIYELLSSNDIDIDTLIWHKGLHSWQTIKTIGEFDISAFSPPELDKAEK